LLALSLGKEELRDELRGPGVVVVEEGPDERHLVPRALGKNLFQVLQVERKRCAPPRRGRKLCSPMTTVSSMSRLKVRNRGLGGGDRRTREGMLLDLAELVFHSSCAPELMRMMVPMVSTKLAIRSPNFHFSGRRMAFARRG
jgi:hypothetical protein